VAGFSGKLDEGLVGGDLVILESEVGNRVLQDLVLGEGTRYGGQIAGQGQGVVF